MAKGIDNFYNFITKSSYNSLLKEVDYTLSLPQKVSAQYRRVIDAIHYILAFGDS